MPPDQYKFILGYSCTQSLLEKSGRTLIKCNATRWNSTLFMIQRLLEIRQPLNDVLDTVGIDGLMASEWQKVDVLNKLLKPFQTHTDILQSDTLALSNVIPVLLDLTCHLQEPCHNQRVALSLLKELKSRFAQILDPQDPDFDPLAATACFLDPSVGMILLNSSDTEPVLKAAQHHLLQLITEVF